MKNPKKRETTNRDEMMCTRCSTEGLKENPAYIDEYDGRSALLKATRCPNEECPYHRGVPEDKVEMQMPESSILDVFNTPSNLSATDILTGVAIVSVLIFMAFSYGIGPFGTDTVSENPDLIGQENPITVSGSVPTSGQGNPEVLLYSDGEQYSQTTATDGQYTFEFNNISTGEYNVYLDYSDTKSPAGKSIEVTQDAQNYSVNFDRIGETVDINLNQSIGRSEILLNYSNPTNIDDITLDLSPFNTEQIERSRELSTRRTENVILPVFPQSQEYRINAPYTTEQFTETKTYRSQPQDYTVNGNVDAENITISLTEREEAQNITRTFNIPDSGAKRDIEVTSESTLGPVAITLRDGTSAQTEQVSGTWDGQNNITIQTGADQFVSGNLQVSPSTIESNKEITGSITGSQIQHNFDGNIPISDATIQFEGGELQASTRGEASISADASQGSTGIINEEIFTANSAGSYRLEWSTSTQQNEDLVNYAYEINNQRFDISGSSQQTLDLSQGDTVRLVTEAEMNTLVENDQNPPEFVSQLNDNLEITDVKFSKNNPDPSEILSVSVTVENTGIQEVSDTIKLYQNGNVVGDQRITLSAGESTELGVFEFGEPTASDKSGVGVWYVNDRGPYLLNVGINERQYGVGSSEATLYDVGSAGTVSVDTDNDGEVDCEVGASTGECQFGTLRAGENDIAVSEDGVTGTSYTIQYTAKENPRGVRVDVGDDGITDLQYDGILRSSESVPVELSPNSENISITVENGIPLDYGLNWESSSVIDNPVVNVGGSNLISNTGTFVESRTFYIDSLSEGTHTLRFSSASGGYSADIEWSPRENQSYPSAIIDGQRVCEPPQFASDLNCTVSNTGLSPGEHTLQFQQPASQVFNYQISQNARAVATSVDLSINNERVKTFSIPSPEIRPWDYVESTSDFVRGENRVDIDVQEENGITPDANVKLRYVLNSRSVEGLDIIVQDSNGNEKEVQIPQSSLQGTQLVSDATVTIDSSDLSAGENRIQFRPTAGVFELDGRIRINEDDKIEFRTLG